MNRETRELLERYAALLERLIDSETTEDCGCGGSYVTWDVPALVELQQAEIDVRDALFKASTPLRAAS